MSNSESDAPREDHKEIKYEAEEPVDDVTEPVKEDPDEDIEGVQSSFDVIDCTPVGESREHKQRLETRDRRPWRLGNLALGAHYVLAGILLNVIQGVMYGVMLGTMAVSGRVYATAKIFVISPWCLKCVFGWISDSFPVNGYHRKYYCVYGWFLSCLAHVVLAVIFREPAVPKYCIDTGHGDLGNYVPEAGICNPEADKDAHLLTVFLTLSVLGTTLAESAADGLTMECAQSWRYSADRGRILMQSMALRLLGGSIGSCFLAFCFNSRKHLGWFHWELPFTVINLGLGGIGLCMILLWLFLGQEDVPDIAPRKCTECLCCKCCSWCASPDPSIMVPAATFHNATTYCQDAWGMHRRVSKTLCSSLFAKFMLFQLVGSVLCWTISPANEMMKRYWAQVQQMQEQLGDVVESLIFTLSITVFQSVLLKVSWRNLTAIGAVIGCIGAVTVHTITALDVLRDQYFYLTVDLFFQIPRAVNFLVGTWIVSEISPPRLEGTIFGLVASVHSLAPVLARAVANPLYAYLPVRSSHLPVGSLSRVELYTEDSKPFRMAVCVSVWTGAALVGLQAMLVRLLPHDSPSARASQLIKLNRYTKCCGTFWLPATCNSIRWYTGAAMCFGLFLTAVLFTLLALLPSSNSELAP